VKKISKSVNN